MKIKALFSNLLMTSAVFSSSVAMAAPRYSYSVNTINVAALDARIDSGVATGKLTRREEHILRSELKNLRSAVKSALKDHHLTKTERAALEHKESN